MAILGLIIVLAAGGLLADSFFTTSESTTFSVFGLHQTMSVGQIVLVGAAAGLIFALGLVILFGGLSRSARRRRETRQVVVKNRTEAEDLRAENERLADELRRRTAAPVVATTGDVADRPMADPMHEQRLDTSGSPLGVHEQGVNEQGVHEHGVHEAAISEPGVDAGSQTYGQPVAYPQEPVALRNDVSTGSLQAEDTRGGL